MTFAKGGLCVIRPSSALARAGGRKALLILLSGALAGCMGGGAQENATPPQADAPLPGATPPPSQQQLFQSGESTRVLDPFQLEQVGPVGGGAQAIGVAPGGHVIAPGLGGGAPAAVRLDGVGNGGF
jgi:hypothetical protein